MDMSRTTQGTSFAKLRIGPISLCSIIALSVMLLAQSCGKDKLHEEGPTGIRPVIGEPFIPPPDEVLPLIDRAKRRMTQVLLGAKSDGEMSLSEGLWLSEALMNSEKGDASRSGEEWVTGTLTYTVPVRVKTDGSVWMDEADFYISYNEALSRLNSTKPNKVYVLDHELVSVVNGIATFSIEWSDMDSIAGPYTPVNSGCHDVHVAAGMLTSLLHWNFHAVAPELPSFFVSVVSPSGDSWGLVFPNDEVPPNSFGVQGYYGTSPSNGGSLLLYNGSGTVCFPEARDRLLIARSIILENADIPSPLQVIREKVEPYSYLVGQIPIGNYPTGFWNHMYMYKLGYMVLTP